MRTFVVLMSRNEDLEQHTYLDGVYSCLAMACLEGLEHELYRDRKYSPIFFEAELEGGKNSRVSRQLAIDFAKLKYPHRFDDKNNIIEEGL